MQKKVKNRQKLDFGVKKALDRGPRQFLFLRKRFSLPQKLIFPSTENEFLFHRKLNLQEGKISTAIYRSKSIDWAWSAARSIRDLEGTMGACPGLMRTSRHRDGHGPLLCPRGFRTGTRGPIPGTPWSSASWKDTGAPSGLRVARDTVPPSSACSPPLQPRHLLCRLGESLTLHLESTDWAGPSARTATPIPAYDPVRDDMRQRRQGSGKPGVPEATAPVVLKLVDMTDPPLRLFLGATANAMIHAEYEKRLAEWDRFDHLSVQAHGLAQHPTGAAR